MAIILGIFSWPQLARVTKNSTMKIREMQYIEACTCLGLSKPRILFKHILINATGPVFVNMTLVMASAVLTEASLSFLGLGDPTTWSWGTMLKRAMGAERRDQLPQSLVVVAAAQLVHRRVCGLLQFAGNGHQ